MVSAITVRITTYLCLVILHAPRLMRSGELCAFQSSILSVVLLGLFVRAGAMPVFQFPAQASRAHMNRD